MSEEFDFIVVGAGTAGCTLASFLAAAHPRSPVLILEAGIDTLSYDLPATDPLVAFKRPELDYGYSTVPQRHLGNRVIPYARGKGLGGSSTSNFMFWTVGSADDYDRWAALVGDDAWSWERVKEDTKRSHDAMPAGFDETATVPRKSAGWNRKINISHSLDWTPEMTPVLKAFTSSEIPWNPDTNSGDPIGVGLTWFSHNRKTRTSSSAYLGDDKPKNLTVWTDSTVVKILLEGAKATGVQLSNGSVVNAKHEVILSCGAFNTPSLLMSSGIGPEEVLRSAGLNVGVNLPGVGQNLGDHCFVCLEAVIDRNITNTEKGDRPIEPEDGSPLIAWLKLGEALRSDEYRALPLEIQNHISKPRTPTSEFALKFTPDPNDKEIILLKIAVAPMNAQSTGTVTINSSNPNDSPVIDPNLLSHAYDRRVMAEAVKKGVEFLENPAVKPFIKRVTLGPKSTADEDIKAYICHNSTLMWHANGTVKMGKRGELLACVDTDFKVIGVQGLRVADLSVCPFTPNCHTQSYAYLIGWMAAGKLSTEYFIK